MKLLNKFSFKPSFLSTSSDFSIIKKPQINFKEKFEHQLQLNKIEEEKRLVIVKSLEFMVGNTENAKLWRLGRPTVSFGNKTKNRARYVKEIKQRITKDLEKFNQTNNEGLNRNRFSFIQQNKKHEKSKDKNFNFYKSKFGLRENQFDYE